MSIKRLRQRDWSQAWKRHFRPIEIGSQLLIKPSWSRRRARARQAVVVLDPGLSFGTGQHPTTAFCLTQLARFQRRGELQSCLDLGTGSGILAIAAARLGYHPIEALDYDSDAVGIARANARRNGVEHRIRFRRQDVVRLARRGGRRYAIVCANLLADLLQAERDRILARLARGGQLILAGILRSEFLKVQRAYEAAGLELITSRAELEWKSGCFAWRAL